MGVLSEAGPAADDQMESDSDMSSGREREFFGSESGDDMKISHAVSKADSDEEMIQTGDMRAGADDPGSEETKSVKMKKTPRQPSQREREEHERTHLPFRDWCTHCIKAKSRNDPHKRETDEMKSEELRDEAISTVSFDYSYLGNDKLGSDDEGGIQRGAEQGDETDEQAHDCCRGPRNRSHIRPHVLAEGTR